jgi:hypothetical protein
MGKFVSWSGAVAIVTGFVFASVARSEDNKEEKVAVDKIPKKVMEVINKRFPDAKITSAEKETENGKVVYDIELTHKGRKYEMDIKEDGTILEIEKQIDAKDLPKAVTKAVEAKYPKASLEEIMEVNKVEGKKEKPIHYEIVIVTADKKKLEVIVSLDGKSIKGEKAEGDKNKEAGEEKVPLDKLPKAVKDAVVKRFPKAELKGAEKEIENGKAVYEVAIVYKGQKIEVTLTPKGEITEIEKQIAAKDMPKEVTKALEDKYPKATYKMIEEVIKVKDNKETLEYYEVLLETAEKKKFEVSVAPDGKIQKVEDKNKKKEEK